MKHTRELAPGVMLMWDDVSGIARVENYNTGLGYAAHPNIKYPRSAEDMRKRGAWKADERTVESQRFIYNIDRLTIRDPLDDVARQHCRCGGKHDVAQWYDFANQQWVEAPSG